MKGNGKPHPHPTAQPGDGQEWTPGVVVKCQRLRGYLEIEFSQHALEQMKIRQISREDVISTIRTPDLTDLPTQSGRLRFRCYRGTTRAIDVVFEEHSRLVVVTAMRVTLKTKDRPT